MTHHAACILLASHNGAQYIDAMLSSLQRQTCRDWYLYTRDDNSSDNTVEMVAEFLKQAQGQLIEGGERIGTAASFSQLMRVAFDRGENYFFFADQDDVWDSNKMSDQLDLMTELEDRYPQVPILLHSDMSVVDSGLRQIAPSFMRYQSIHHEPLAPLDVLLIQNFVTGCTVLANRPMVGLALPIPETAIMHDWWLALCAAACGHIGYIDKPLVKYRQHDNNTVGAKTFYSQAAALREADSIRKSLGSDKLRNAMEQAAALSVRLRSYDAPQQTAGKVEAFSELSNQSLLPRLNSLLKLKVHSQTLVRNCLLLARISAL